MALGENYKEGVHPAALDSVGGFQQGNVAVYAAPAATGDRQVALPTGTAPWLTPPFGINRSAGYVGGTGTTSGETLDLTRQGISTVLLKNGTAATRGGKMIASATLGYVQPYTDYSFSAWILGTFEEALTASSTSDQVTAYVQPYFQAIVRPVTAGTTSTFGANTRFLGAVGSTIASAQVPLYVARFAGETIRNLAATLVTAPGGTDTVVFTVQKSSDNGATWADTALTCTITGVAKSASDLTDAVVLAAGDILAIKTVSSATTAAQATATFDVT